VGPCDTGDARITAGYQLPAAHVIHTVGPVYRDGRSGEREMLESCYRRSLELAAAHGIRSIAFPSISTGVFGYPIEDAAAVALAVISAWRTSGKQPQEVICCCFSEADAQVYRAAQPE
jgi:O-acetyl-ADP-ribose deacetylase (regulator of RNase III)